MWIENCWYQAGWTEELSAGEVLTRTILDTPIVFYLRADGTPAALLDQCPHRFAPLSAGRVEGDTVECGYHGLVFDHEGACVHNPHGRITKRMCVRSFPVVARHTALWIWMGRHEPDMDAIPDLSEFDKLPETALIRGYMPTAADYRLLVDNIMDLTHADYLHPTTLGGLMNVAVHETHEADDKIIAEWTSLSCDPPGAFKMMIPEGKGDFRTVVEWQAPALMLLTASGMPEGVAPSEADLSVTLHNMVPETYGRTHYFYCNSRRFMPDDEQLSAFLRVNLEKAFQDEDKPMLEKQQARIGQRDFWQLEPILLTTDNAAIKVRRRTDQLIAAERGE
jgi:phenylpropionate dioxygenase-like ring-hydroxylating dioxygenase large terminal subunit